MQCKELEPGMILFISNRSLKAWFSQSKDCIFPRMRVGTFEWANDDGFVEFVSCEDPILYIGQSTVELAGRGSRRVRLFYANSKVCYIECFNVHNLEKRFD
jgi:hypothetical protein